MFELDRTRRRGSATKLNRDHYTIVETNGHHCIVVDLRGDHWMSVPVWNKSYFYDLYPMRAL